MAAYRINERNTGSWSLGSEPKKRTSKSEPLTYAEMRMAQSVVESLLDCLEFDPEASEGKGRLTNDAVFTAQDFLYQTKRGGLEALTSFLEKITKMTETAKNIQYDTN